MQLPADLSEGWWWVRWTDGRTSVERIFYSRILRRWMMAAPDKPLDEAAGWMSAMERVAPPSWEAGRG